MQIKLAVVIMAHPSRREWAELLSNELGAPVVYDRISNVWDTCRRAWLKGLTLKADYVLVLQDDALVCPDFMRRAEQFIRYHQDEDFIFSFFAGQMLGERIRHAITNKRDYVISGMIYNEIALCMKTEHIERMVEFCDRHEATTDHFINQWSRMRHMKIIYSVPSLIEHRTSTSIYRTVYGKPMPDQERKAYFYAEDSTPKN